MNERCAQLLIKIIMSEGPIKIGELANEFKVSPRTIRYDLDRIDRFLKDNNLPQLMRKPRVGVFYNGSREYKEKVLFLLNKFGRYNCGLTKEEREKFILLELFRARDYITIENLSNILGVSRGTVISDLKKVKKWLRKYNVELESSPHYGIKIKGEETDIRRAVVYLFSEYIDIEKALDVMKTSAYGHKNSAINSQLKKLFENINITYIENAVKMAQEQLNSTFSDAAYAGLVVHLALAIKRIQLGKDILMPKDELERLKLTKEFAVASSIAKSLEQSYGVKIPIDEIGYITLHLLGGKVTSSNAFVKEEWAKLQFLTARIIRDVQDIIGVDFCSDDELYRGLMEHLGPTVYRLKHKLPLKNPILREIKENYPEIFEAVKNGLNALIDYVKCEIPEEEIGYIAIHFGAALERMRAKNRKVYRALVVCGTGIGTAKLLASRIKAEFDDIEIIGTIPSHQLKEFSFKRNNVDLIISTVYIDNNLRSDVLCVTVNPLLPKADVLRISNILKEQNQTLKAVRRRNLFAVDGLIKIIEKYCTINSKKELIEQLERYLCDNLHLINLKGVAQPVLDELITEKTIMLNIEAENWEEAVRKGGEILVENGFVEPRYVDAMIKTVKEVGPYIVIAPGIAMPHARPEDGVKQVCMSLITLKNPVEFGNETNDPVRLIISFGAVDQNSHLKALSKLMNLFTNQKYIEEILETSDVKKVIEIIKECSSKEV
ncbi:BglG family transcription antiterminator [Thermovorax subterraneus]|nr:BglG family transcription antiterminator [Thermovorax subterraneus]